MYSVEETKRGLDLCKARIEGGTLRECSHECPYWPEGGFCRNALHADASRLIQQLEIKEKQAKMQEDTEK